MIITINDVDARVSFIEIFKTIYMIILRATHHGIYSYAENGDRGTERNPI